ncbi:Uncharacterised protein [Clostridioides difficile]|nr:Uncharacterised protein [Clostridioides difficile]
MNLVSYHYDTALGFILTIWNVNYCGFDNEVEVKKGFILTIWNVNSESKAIPNSWSGEFYINYMECKFR